MGRLLFLIFTIVPVVEVWLLMRVGALIGFGGTLALVVVTGALGAALAKGEGRRALRAWRHDLQAGRAPKDGVLDGALLLVGGVLLVTPGVVTDVVGLLLLVPFTRRTLSALIRGQLEAAASAGKIHVVYGDSSPFGASSFNGPSPFAQRAVPQREMPRIVEVQGEELESDV